MDPEVARQDFQWSDKDSGNILSPNSTDIWALLKRLSDYLERTIKRLVHA